MVGARGRQSISQLCRIGRRLNRAEVRLWYLLIGCPQLRQRRVAGCIRHSREGLIESPDILLLEMPCLLRKRKPETSVKVFAKRAVKGTRNGETQPSGYQSGNANRTGREVHCSCSIRNSTRVAETARPSSIRFSPA